MNNIDNDNDPDHNDELYYILLFQYIYSLKCFLFSDKQVKIIGTSSLQLQRFDSQPCQGRVWPAGHQHGKNQKTVNSEDTDGN